MKIILLSGGSGTRLWPLSNDARSKQFLRFLMAPDGSKESMIQRVVRQIKAAGFAGEIVVATGVNQKDSVANQLGDLLSVVTEPERRDTFPAIILACSFLASKGTPLDEPVIVMPCDTFTDDACFSVISLMEKAVSNRFADIILLGTAPTYPSDKYGYILPDGPTGTYGDAAPVKLFTEKPDAETARRLIADGALWNGGVFAFRLGFVTDIMGRMMPGMDFDAIRAAYSRLPKISFDYEVVEKTGSLGVIPYAGRWKDLGTWNTLTDELADLTHGNVVAEDCSGTYIINELETPLVCIGANNLVVAATPDGILVTERKRSEKIKEIVDGLGRRPMYEERRWGEYKVIDSISFPDGFCALTKQLNIRPGCSISYQRHSFREEIWTFVDGEGEIVLDGVRRRVCRGDVVRISQGQLHALRAITPLTLIEVQQGSNLVEDDIERFDYSW